MLMVGCQGRWTNTWGLWGAQIFWRISCLQQSLFVGLPRWHWLPLLACSSGLTPPWKHELSCKHLFMPLHLLTSASPSLLPFRLSIVSPRPCLLFRGAVKKRHSRHGLKINPILDPLDRLPHLSRDPLRSACYPSCQTPLMARLRRGGCHRGLDRIS